MERNRAIIGRLAAAATILRMIPVFVDNRSRKCSTAAIGVIYGKLDTVYATATDFYPLGTQDTSNANDNVFSDSLASEFAKVSGSITDGYALTHLITVAA